MSFYEFIHFLERELRNITFHRERIAVAKVKEEKTDAIIFVHADDYRSMFRLLFCVAVRRVSD